MSKIHRLIALIGLFVAPALMQAQEQIVVTGTVRTPAGAPINDAQVIAVGSPRVARTDARGVYRLPVTGTIGQVVTLRATRIGHQFQIARVAISQASTVTQNFTLAEQAASLEAVVVTGSPTGTATRREVANVVAQLPAAELIERVPAIGNVTAVLQSRIPGVQVLSQSGAEGTASRIRIRGVSSINASSAPIYVIDGIRMSGGTQGGFGLSGASQSASDAIHPQDVQSIEVIKGPAASTLYGADAANGVIAITTKRGTVGEQSMQVNLNSSFGIQEWSGRTNTNYALCTPARIAAATSGTVGSFPGCAGLADNTLISADLLRDAPDALRTGHTRTLHGDVTGGGERYGFYLGGALDDNDGVVYNNTFKRYSGRANATFVASDKITTDVNIGYYRTDVRLPLSDNSSNGLTRNANRAIPGRLGNFGIGWLGLSPNEINAFDDETRSDRFIMAATARYNPFSWFSNRLSGGFDFSNRRNQEFYAIDTTGKAPYGSIAATGEVDQYKPINRLYTIDYAGTISNTFHGNISSAFSFGSQLIATRFEALQVQGYGLPSNDIRLINLAGTRNVLGDQISEQSTLGFLVQEKLGFRDRLYITAGLRTDNNSAFGKSINFVAYPKLGASYVISEEPFFKVSGIDELRLRAAWGLAGTAPSPYAADRTFSSTQLVIGDLTTRPGIVPSNFGNPQLFAEKGEEMEFGFDVTFLKNRVRSDFTYYDKTTRDALIPVPVAPSSGYTGSILQNVGVISNKGIELSTTVIPVDRTDLNWESRVAIATLKNRFVDFGGVRTDPIYSGFTVTNIGLRTAPGTTVPQFFGTVPSVDANGNYLRTSTGGFIVDRDTVYFGGSLPTRTVSWDNTVTLFKDVRVGAQLDYQGGHYQFNLTRRTRNIDGITRETADPAADTLQRLLLLSGAGAQYIEKADFLKLREISVNWTLPRRLTRNISADRVTLSVSARNLKTWTDYTGSDPEVNADAGDFLLAETNAIPPARRITTSLSFRF